MGQCMSGSNNAGTVSDNAGRSETAGLGRDDAMLVLDQKMQVPENNNAGPLKGYFVARSDVGRKGNTFDGKESKWPIIGVQIYLVKNIHF